MPSDRDGDLHHLNERDRPFLHPSATGRRCGQERKSLCGGSFDRPNETLGGGYADRTRQEAEFTGDQRDAPTGDAALAGQHRLIQSRLRPGARQLRVIARIQVRRWGHRLVPALEGPCIKHEVHDLLGTQAVTHSVDSRSGERWSSSSSQCRTVWLCCPSVGGGR